MGSLLPFVAVGRVEDGKTLAHHVIDDAEKAKDFQAIFRKLLLVASQKLQPGQRLRLQWEIGSVCCFREQAGKLVYCVVTAQLHYPEDLAYNLLEELAAAVQQEDLQYTTCPEDGLQDDLQPRMAEMIGRYEASTVANDHRHRTPSFRSKSFAHMSSSVAAMGNRPKMQYALAIGGGLLCLLMTISVLHALFWPRSGEAEEDAANVGDHFLARSSRLL